MQAEWVLKDKAAIAGIGQSKFYKRGASPVSDFQLACQAIINAAADAGIAVRDVDGLTTFAGTPHWDPDLMAHVLGLRELRFSDSPWTGGGGVTSAVCNAAMAVTSGLASHVIALKTLKQSTVRFGQGNTSTDMSGAYAYMLPYGMLTPAHKIAMRVRRFMHEYNVKQDALAAVSMASYHHAQFNRNAVAYGKPLTRETYDNSRWIVEPFHLFDCCMENDGAVAILVTTAERSRDLKAPPVYITAAAQGMEFRNYKNSNNPPDFASSNYKLIGPRVFEMAGLKPSDIDVVQSYDHFSGAVVATLYEHGFCERDEINEFCTFENLTWPQGKLPINTSGGNLAECYVNGLQLVSEGVRQLRGVSTCQVKDAEFAVVISGSMTSPTGNMILRR